MTDTTFTEKLIKEASQYETDLTELSALLTKAGIAHQLRKHPSFIAMQEAGITKLYPAGQWQILISIAGVPKRQRNNLSIIRGMVSFGDYEVYGGNMEDPIRTTTAAEMVKLVKRLSKKR